MKHLSIAIALLFFPVLTETGRSQPAGALTPEIIQSMRAALPLDPRTRVMINAVTVNGVKSLATNREAALGTNSHFSNRIKTEGITDQKSSGRCWLFAGLNIMRPVAMTSLNKKGFEFSQTYLFFWDKLEKANLFLESIIQTRARPIDDREVEWLLKNPFPDGGQWNMVLALIEKYGVVPAEIMPETESSGNTGLLNGLVSTKLRRDAARLRMMHEQGKSVSELETVKRDMLTEVYRMLVIHLGTPPTEFTWRYENKEGKITGPVTYTPLEFYRKFVNLKLDDYLCLQSVPTQPFNRLYEIQFDRNLYDKPNMTFANLPMATLKALTLQSVLDNEPVWFGCDVGKDSDSKTGLMKLGLYDYASIYGIDFTMTKADRVLYQESIPTHAMVIMGVDMVDGKSEKWLVENSWGAKSGRDGFFTMYDSWFDEYTYAVIINKKFIPKDILELFKTKSTVLPPWDPMFAMWWH